MDAETKTQLQQHVKAIAAILHSEADPQALKTFEGIETSLRSLTEAHVLPELAIFLSKPRPEPGPAKAECSTASSETCPSPANKLND
jgi:hypothetical protein